MRLTADQTQTIRQLARQVAGNRSRVRVFGSRLDDTAHGGDVDLMLELPEPVTNPCAHGYANGRTGITRHARTQSGRAAQRPQSYAPAHP